MKEFQKRYKKHLSAIKKEFPEITFIGADGAPRSSRDKKYILRDQTIVEAIKQLLGVVNTLRQSYPSKRFTLDGRLVGDLGEVVAESFYDINLFPGLQKHYDAKSADGRLVQIKTTMQSALTFPADHVPDYYLGIKIFPDGRFKEIFNGKGEQVYQLIKDNKKPKNNQHSISINKLLHENIQVHPSDRIPLSKPEKAQ